MLIWGLGEANLGGFGGDGFLIGNDRVGLDDLNVRELSDQIMEANFDMQLSASGDNVFSSGFISGTLYQRIRLGKFLQSID